LIKCISFNNKKKNHLAYLQGCLCTTCKVVSATFHFLFKWLKILNKLVINVSVADIEVVVS